MTSLRILRIAIFLIFPGIHGLAVATMLSGHVTDADTAAPVSGASVYGSVLFQPNQSFATTTDANGYYAVDVASGDYSLSAVADGYLQALGAAGVASDPVVVDFSLSRPATISGTVRDQVSGEGIADEIVLLKPLAPGNPPSQAQSAGDGSYTIGNIVPGDYAVCVQNSSDAYLDQCYELMNVPASGVAVYTTVQVSSGEHRTGVDFALQVGSTLTGTLQDRYFGTPIADTAMTFLLYSPLKDIVVRTSAVTDASGHYSIGGVAAGDYYVAAGANAVYGVANTFYTFTLYSSAPCAQPCSLDDATLVTVPEAGTHTGVDILVQPGHVMTGKVTDSQSGLGTAGVSVQTCEYTALFAVTAQATTMADGSYVLAHVLANGATSLYTSNVLGYVDLGWPAVPIYGNAFCGGFVGGSPSFGQNFVLTDINFALTRGAAISGHVSALEFPSAGIGADVSVWQDTGGGLAPAWQGRTDANGDYQTSGLQTGTYYVRGDEPGDCQVYSGQPCDFIYDAGIVPTASPIIFADAQTQTGVDLQLKVEIFHANFD